MSGWERLADRRIREAMENGEFEDLEGKGKPLDLSSYFQMPPHLRIAQTILKNANVLPHEVELMREIVQLKQSLESCEEETARRTIRQAINLRSVELNIMLERGACRCGNPR